MTDPIDEARVRDLAESTRNLAPLTGDEIRELARACLALLEERADLADWHANEDAIRKEKFDALHAVLEAARRVDTQSDCRTRFHEDDELRDAITAADAALKGETP